MSGQFLRRSSFSNTHCLSVFPLPLFSPGFLNRGPRPSWGPRTEAFTN